MSQYDVLDVVMTLQEYKLGMRALGWPEDEAKRLLMYQIGPKASLDVIRDATQDIRQAAARCYSVINASPNS